MQMNRRAFSAALVAGTAASLIATRGTVAMPAPPKARNVVLVHGLFADGSCWSEVIARLQAAGLNVTAGAKPANDAARSGRFGRAGAGAAGWPDGSRRSFLFRDDRHGGRSAS